MNNDVNFFQLATLMAKMEDMLRGVDNPVVFVCGDFNMLPFRWGLKIKLFRVLFLSASFLLHSSSLLLTFQFSQHKHITHTHTHTHTQQRHLSIHAAR